jgi:hypothetical protein
MKMQVPGSSGVADQGLADIGEIRFSEGKPVKLKPCNSRFPMKNARPEQFSRGKWLPGRTYHFIHYSQWSVQYEGKSSIFGTVTLNTR